MQQIRINKVKELLSNITEVNEQKYPIAIFPHRTGTNSTILEWLKNNPKIGEINRHGKIKAHEDTTAIFIDFSLIPATQEIFNNIIVKLIVASKIYNNHLILLFDDWEGVRHDDMRPDLEKALNWIKQFPDPIEVYNCEANVFHEGKAID